MVVQMTQLAEEGTEFDIPTYINFKDYVTTFVKAKRT